MELYTTSSYNETMSGGETLSSISEKSCISGTQQQPQQQQTTCLGSSNGSSSGGNNNPVMINSASLQDYQDAVYMVRDQYL